MAERSAVTGVQVQANWVDQNGWLIQGVDVAQTSVLLAVHRLWPELRFAGEDVELVAEPGVYLIPMPGSVWNQLEAEGVWTGQVEVPGLGGSIRLHAETP